MSFRKSDPKFVRAYERGMLRSAFKSLFWGIIAEKKKQDAGFTMIKLARDVSTSKHEVSRWFNGDPNWTINTISSLAAALNVDIEIRAIDRATGVIFTPAGIQSQTASQSPRRESISIPLGTDRPVDTRIVKRPAQFFNDPPQTSSKAA